MLTQALRDRLLRLAQDCDLLLLGEMHGTREVPLLAASLLGPLNDIGYEALALELPAEALSDILRWAGLPDSPLPALFLDPPGDGRVNMEVLSLIGEAIRRDWRLICFGLGTMFCPMTPSLKGLAELNDSGMAANLLRQWDAACPHGKVLGICGRVHSGLGGVGRRSDLAEWSMAQRILASRPQTRICSIRIRFRRGSYYNHSVEHIYAWPFGRMLTRSGCRDARTATLVLPSATAATLHERGSA